MQPGKPQYGGGFAQSAAIPDGRIVRIELSGESSDKERNFLSGISYFAADTLGKKSDKHLVHVSGLMAGLMGFLTPKDKQENP